MQNNKMDMKEMIAVSNEISKKNGFWDDSLAPKYYLATKLALILTEVDEARDVLENDILLRGDDEFDGEFDAQAFGEELADILIRSFDMIGEYDLMVPEKVAQIMNMDVNNLYLENIQKVGGDIPFEDFSEVNMNVRLMDIVSPIAKCVQALRKDDDSSLIENMAQIVIRVCFIASGIGVDIHGMVEQKIEKNRSRPYKHGRSF